MEIDTKYCSENINNKILMNLSIQEGSPSRKRLLQHSKYSQDANCTMLEVINNDPYLLKSNAKNFKLSRERRKAFPTASDVAPVTILRKEASKGMASSSFKVYDSVIPIPQVRNDVQEVRRARIINAKKPAPREIGRARITQRHLKPSIRYEPPKPIKNQRRSVRRQQKMLNQQKRQLKNCQSKPLLKKLWRQLC
jgi:hypothetical protein